MSRIAQLYGDQSAVNVLLTGPKRRRGQRVGFSVAISPSEVRGAIDNNLIQGVQNRLGVEAERLVTGVIDVDEWYKLTEPLVRAVHYAAALAAAGGVASFNGVHRDLVEARIAGQLAYLRNFAAELKSGKQPLNGFVPFRARMYADAAVATYEAVRRGAFQDAEYALERRVVNPAAEHCAPCLEYAARGWQPIGSLPPIGDSPCRTRCRCTFEYRRDASGELPLPPVLPALPNTGKSHTVIAPASSSQIDYLIEAPTLDLVGDFLKVVAPPSAEDDFMASLARYWKPQGTGWVHVDGTRIEKTVSGAFKVISRAGDELRTFRTAEAAFRFVDGGGLELATDARGHEHKGKGPGGGQFTGPGKTGNTGEKVKKAAGGSGVEAKAAKKSKPSTKPRVYANRKVAQSNRRGNYVASWNFYDNAGERYEQTVRVESGTVEGEDGEDIDVWRWVSDQDGSETERGDWIDDEQMATDQGEEYAQQNDMPAPEEDDEQEEPEEDLDNPGFYRPNPDLDAAMNGPPAPSDGKGDPLGNLSDDDVKKLAGVPANAKVKKSRPKKWESVYSDDVQLNAVGVDVEITHPKLKSCKQFIGVDSAGKKFIQIRLIEVKKEYQGQGFGTQLIADQIKNAAEQGFAYIQLHAAGRAGADNFNGYYTWPLLGWDQAIPSPPAMLGKKIKSEYPDAKTVLDVMSAPGGREWWKKNGQDLYDARFDLKDGSRSRKVLENYLETKRKKQNV